MVVGRAGFPAVKANEPGTWAAAARGRPGKNKNILCMASVEPMLWLVAQAKDTVAIRQHIAATHLQFMPDDPVWEQMYCESSLDEDAFPPAEPRVGAQYQAVILAPATGESQ